MHWTFGCFDRGGICALARLSTVAIGCGLWIPAASGQLVSNVEAIPRTGRPPVVFLNGYQSSCVGSNFRSTFDRADQILQQDQRVSLFFDNCAFPGHPPIETLGNELGKFLRSLRYTTGEPVPQVDVVAHSMGGLILRSYLSGKQTEEGVFLPPSETMIRKSVFLGTPHFGSPATSLLAGLGGTGDAQTTQLQPGSRFVFDLATWNQGTDDLRGVDAISVVGTASNGSLLMRSGFGDGVTTLTSGSLGFYGTGRTRVVPLCHTGGITALICTGGSGQLAHMNSADHQSARILLSFLNDTPEWRSVGTSPEQNTFLSTGGGLLVRYRDAFDRTLQLEKAASAQGELPIIDKSLFFTDFLPAAQPLAVTLTLANNVTAALSIPLVTGSTRAVTAKPGPVINAVFPSAAALFPRSVAPGSLISIYGSQLVTPSGASEVSISGQPTQLSFAGPDQINTVVPENASGLVKLQVKNAAGEHTANVLVEPVVPALFAPALNASSGALVTAQAPLRRGDYVALFLTGLGRTELRNGLNWAVAMPDVSFGGQPCVVTFAGRAPGFSGLDQINCMISADVQASDAAPVVVQSRGRISNVSTLPVR